MVCQDFADNGKKKKKRKRKPNKEDGSLGTLFIRDPGQLVQIWMNL